MVHFSKREFASTDNAGKWLFVADASNEVAECYSVVDDMNTTIFSNGANSGNAMHATGTIFSSRTNVSNGGRDNAKHQRIVCMARKIFLPMIVITILGLSMFQKANAYPLTHTGTVDAYISGIGFGSYDVLNGPMVLNPPIEILVPRFPYTGPPIIISGGIHLGYEKQLFNELAVNSTFDFISDENLLVKSNANGICKLYELTSGKQVTNNIIVQGNNSYQAINFNFENKPYFIQFEVNGQIIYQQTFYFSNNNLYKGDK